MSNSSLISILLPIYNTSAYLHQCLDSVLAQTYTKLQVVLVDDGSKDNSLEICMQYADKDTRIEVYHQENQGVSATRNHLLEKVKGDYVLFVDSDDWIEPNMVEFLLEKALTNNAEMVVCGNVINDTAPASEYTEELWSQDKAVMEFLRHVRFNGSLCNKLIKVSLLHNEPRFHLGISYGEDALFCWELLQEARSVIVTDKQLYHYRMNAASLSHISWTPEKKGSCHWVWKKIVSETEKLWPQYINIAKARYAIEDMWGLFYASLADYPYDAHIKERQQVVRNNFRLIRKSGLVSKNKIVMAYSLAHYYNLGKMLKFMTK